MQSITSYLDNRKFKPSPVQYGAIIGISMTSILLIFQFLPFEVGAGWKWLRYAPMIAFMAIMLFKMKEQMQSEKIFIHGLTKVIITSAVAGTVLATFELIWTFAFPDYALTIYGMEGQKVGRWLIIAALLALETFVLGSIIGFAILQYLKEKIIY